MSKKVISLLLAALLLLPAGRVFAAESDDLTSGLSLTIKNKTTTYFTLQNGDDSEYSSLWTVQSSHLGKTVKTIGEYVFCGNPGNVPPPSGITSEPGTRSTDDGAVLREEKNENVRKILYYGAGGPAPWDGYRSLSGIYQNNDAGIDFKLAQFYQITHQELGFYLPERAGQKTRSDLVGQTEFRLFWQRQPAPPENFHVLAADWGNATQAMLFWVQSEAMGTLRIQKESNDPLYAETHDFQGISFGIFRDSACSDRAGTLSVSADGKSEALKLPPGTYYVKELQSNDFYLRSEKVQSVRVQADKESLCRMTNVPALRPLRVKKQVARDADLCALSGAYVLEGTQFELLDASGKTAAVLTVGENGQTEAVEVRPGKYRLVESKVMPGFLPAAEQSVTIAEGGAEEILVEVENEPVFDSLSLLLKKTDEQGIPLAGAVFTVRYFPEENLSVEDAREQDPLRSWELQTDQEGNLFYREESRVGGDPLFFREDGTPAGLPGTYLVEETGTPEGFLPCEPFTHSIRLEDLGKNSPAEQLFPVSEVIDERQFVRILLQKMDAETGVDVPGPFGSWEGAEFTVTEEGSGEVCAVLKTEADGSALSPPLLPGVYEIRETLAPPGYCPFEEPVREEALLRDAESAEFLYEVEIPETPFRLEIQKTEKGTGAPLAGAVLRLENEEGETVDRWTSETEAHVLSSIPEGNYLLYEEEAPEGCFLLGEPVPIRVTADLPVQTVIVSNERIPEIETRANPLPRLSEEGDAILEDTVSARFLIPGETYELIGTLYDCESGELLKDSGGEAVQQAFVWTAENEEESVKMFFSLPEELVRGKTLVVYEALYRGGKLLCSHEDPENRDQRICCPEIKTKASLQRAGGERGNPVLEDRVTYRNLLPGTYRVRGTLTENGILLRDENGNPLQEETALTVSEQDLPEGEIPVAFRLEGETYAGRELTVLEELLSEDGRVLAAHRDPEDPDQTVRIPEKSPPKKTPETGDASGTGMRESIFGGLLALAGMSAAGIALAHLCRKKEKIPKETKKD